MGLRKRNLYKVAAVGWRVVVLAICMYGGVILKGQSPPSVEIATRQTPPAFILPDRHDLVLMRVVVRDAQGNPVAGLRREDFRVSSDQRPQAITEFSVEKTSPESPQPKPYAPVSEVARGPAASTFDRGAHYTALFFDDNHLAPADLERVREAADHYVASLPSGERVGIFSTSGQVSVDFTNDPRRLRPALPQIRAQSRFLKGGYCPDITPYHAQAILEKSDEQSLPLAIALTFLCRCRCPASVDTALSTAMMVSIHSEMAAEATLKALDQVVRRMEELAGPRTIAFISDGFLRGTHTEDVDSLVDRALRQGVTLTALDARGLCNVLPASDPTRPSQHLSPQDAAAYKEIVRRSFDAEADVLDELAAGTGGSFVHDTADFADGFRHLNGAGGTYLLGFTPHNLASQTEFHDLRVSLANRPSLSVQARRGYYLSESVSVRREAESVRSHGGF